MTAHVMTPACPTCHGTRTCPTCSGKGCSWCFPAFGRCPACSGRAPFKAGQCATTPGGRRAGLAGGGR